MNILTDNKGAGENQEKVNSRKAELIRPVLGNLITAAIGIGLIAFGLSGRPAALPGNTDAEAESLEMAVISAGYTPEIVLTDNAVTHLNYTAMQENMVGWICEFGRINIRDRADFGGSVIDYVVYGDQLSVYEKDGEFTRVKYQSMTTGETREGYCYSEYISGTKPEGAQVYLNVPLYKQADYRWGTIKIGGYETLASAGCTTTCIAMVDTYMTGEDTFPDDTAASLSYTYEGKLTFPRRFEKYYGSDYLSVVLKKLHEGIPSLISGYTSRGKTHWVVIVGYDGDGENLSSEHFLINDPGSYRMTLKEFMEDYPLIEKIVYYGE